MSEVQRICPQCTTAGPLSARYCARCGHDFEGELPAPQNNLPVVLGRAALPVLVGAASVALRLGWKALQSRWAQEAAERAVEAAIGKTQQQPATPPTQGQPVERPSHAVQSRSRRTVTIRSAWSVGDANGIWRQGFSEHQIDFDE
jgi:hypothetical protein